MTDFTTENARNSIKTYFWVDIEGLKYRYGTLPSGVDSVFDAWNPSDAGNNRTIKPWLSDVSIGSQSVDPFNGSCSIANHSFSILDSSDALTALLCVSDTPFENSRLTAPMGSADTVVPVEDSADFSSSGIVYVNRESIAYTGKTDDSASGACYDYLHGFTGKAVTAAANFSLFDNDKDQCVTTDSDIISFMSGHDRFWDGATLEFTTGANNGAKRTILESGKFTPPLSGTDHAYFIFNKPFSNNIAAADQFTLSCPPNCISALALATGDYTGGVLTFTSGKLAGLFSYITSHDTTNRYVEFAPKLPSVVDATTNYAITRHKLTGCTRGMFGSSAPDVDHTPVNDAGGMRVIPVSTKPRFIKTRKCTIYENRVGCAEADAIAYAGFISSASMDSSMSAYSFGASSISQVLSKNLMSNAAKSELEWPMWGGSVEWKYEVTSKAGKTGAVRSKSGKLWKRVGFALGMSDGESSRVSTGAVIVKDHDDFNSDGNVKIDSEIIHYTSKNSVQTVKRDSALNVKFSLVSHKALMLEDDADPYTTAGNWLDWDGVKSASPMSARGLMSSELGLNKKLLSTVVQNTDKFRNPPDEPWDGTYQANIPALMAEHDAGADVAQVCLCNDSPASDFPRFDKVVYENLAGGTFSAGDEITHSNGSTATVMEVYDTSGATGVLTIAFLDPADLDDAEWASGDSFSCGGVSADIDEFVYEKRKRNNAIDALLQLLMSGKSGSAADNGAYDTLPRGFGLGLTSSEIDVSEIEKLRDRYFANVTIDFVIEEQQPAKEWLEDNIFRLLQVFPAENAAGKITMKMLLTRAEAAADNEGGGATTIGNDEILATAVSGWSSGELPISRMNIKHNRIPGSDQYLSNSTLIFEGSESLYDSLGSTKELRFDTLYSSGSDLKAAKHLSSRVPPALQRITSVIWDRMAIYPMPIIDAVCTAANVEDSPGDYVLLTHDALPNMRTSLRGLSGEYFQILEKARDVGAGTVTLKLAQVGVHDNKYARHAPSGLITAYAADTPVAGKSRLTLRARKYSKRDMKDVEHFAAGQECMLVNSRFASIGTNAISHPKQFDNAAWGKTRCSATANSIYSPGALLDADKITEDGSVTDTHFVWDTLSVSTAIQHVFSVYAKAINRDFIRMAYNTKYGFFDIANGEIGGHNCDDARIEYVGNDWYWCRLWLTPPFATSAAQIFIADSISSYSFTGGSQDSIYLYDAHFVPSYVNATIDAVDTTNNYIDFDQNIVPTPAAGNIVTWAKFDDCTSAQQEARVFLADENRLLGTADDSAFKWM